MTQEMHWFEKAARYARKYFSWMARNDNRTQKKLTKYFSADFRETLTFSGLDVEPYDILLISYAGGFLSFFVFFFFDLLVVLSYGSHIEYVDYVTILLMGVLLIVPFIIMNLLANYPKTYARYRKIHSLGDIPEILSYLVMYLKVVPNLENSVRFAASESSTTLAHDLRKLLWDTEIRLYQGLDDALTCFATQWGKWSDYFKRSLHLIRGSIQERNDASRIVTLDRALDVSLEGTKEAMNHFANQLQQPTIILYSIGIMIPLSLVAMLPVVGLVGVRVTIFQVFFLYDLLLPLLVFLYTRKILLSRPVTFHPPEIPSNHPDLVRIHKQRRAIISVLIGFFIALPGLFSVMLPVFVSSDSSNAFVVFIIDPSGLNSYFPVTLFFIWGVAASVTLYCLTVYYPYKKVRDEIKQIEKEFSDALYILGKRISEEKSPEESFLHAAQTMQGAQIAQVFSRTSYNLIANHTNLKDALFSSEYGSLQYVYSDRVKAIMRLFVEGIQKSQQVVSVSIIRIADHLKQLQEVEKKIKDMLYELTSTLQSTVTMFAPLIAGVTLAITKLISNILLALRGNISALDTTSASSPMFSTVIQAFSVENVRPEYFVLVIGIYILELTVLITRFSNGINEGDDKATYMYSLGKIMPSSVIVFSITIIIGQILFSQIIPPA